MPKRRFDCRREEDPSDVDFERLSEIHRSAFGGAARHWRASEIADLARQHASALFSARAVGQMVGFLLLRQVGEEAEVLTVCREQHPGARGAGHALVDAAIRYCEGSGVLRLHLEVSDANETAHKLYRQYGFMSISRRQGYYHNINGSRDDALLMIKVISPTDRLP